MIYTKKTKEAMIIAYEKHKKQKDKSGVPYIFHPIHIAEQMDDEKSTIVALLHDVIEDTSTTFKEIENLDFDKEVIDALKYLTHDKSKNYFDYIRKISKNSLATKVKIADLKHNLDTTRLNKMFDKDKKRNEKYKKCLNYLQDCYKKD